MSLRRCEHEEQVMLIRVCKKHEGKYPELKLLHAIPNGGHRHIAVASKLKAEGVKAGIPDLFLPVPRGELHGLYIEMKAQGGKVSPAQKAMMKALKGQGYGCIVAYTWNQAFETIKEYLSEEVIASYT